MKRLVRLCLAITVLTPAVQTVSSTTAVEAVGTWVNRRAVAIAGLAIPNGGEKYFLARGDALVIPDEFGTNFSNITSQAWAGVSIASSATGSHCIMGETGSSITLRVSTNSCVSWGQKTLVAGTSGSVDAVALSDNGARMYAMASTGVIYTSSNTGTSFSALARTEAWSDIAVTSAGTTLVASTSDGQVLRSTDSGTTMTQVLSETSTQFNALAMSSDGTKIVVGDQSGSLRASSNSGQTWSAVTIPNSSSYPIADVAMSADGTKILVGLNGGKLLRSADGGVTWLEEDSDRNWTAVAMSASGVHMGAGTATNFYASSYALEYSSTSPTNGASTVLNDANIVMNFNNKVSLASGKNLYIKRSSDHSIFETIPVGDSRINLLPVGRVTLDPNGTLALGTSYYVDADVGALSDEYGNTWNRTSNPLQFTTSATDTVAPTVKKKDPPGQYPQPQPTANFSVTFNENVQFVPGKYVQVCWGSNNCTGGSERLAVDDSSKVTVSGATVTLDPETELGLNSSYYIRIEPGAFQDLNGNNFAGITTDSFNVYTVAIDGRAPVFRRACTSSDGQFVHLLYDEKLDTVAMTVNNFAVRVGGVSQSLSSVSVPPHSANVVVRLTTPLSPDMNPTVSYTSSGGSIRDSYLNYSTSTTDADASSRTDCKGPSITSQSPAHNQSGVSTTSAISITFDEPIRTEFGKTFYLRNNTTSSQIEAINWNSNRVSVVGNTLRIRPTSALPANAEISVNAIYSGFVEDQSGNDFWGWESTTVYKFNTGSTGDVSAPSAPSAPTLMAYSDSGVSNSDAVTSNTTVVVRSVAQEDGGIVTLTASRVGQSDVTCTMVGSTSGSTCSLGTLASGEWSVTAQHEDDSSNMSALSASTAVTIDAIAPVLTSVTPASGASGISVGSNIELSFSENVARDFGSISIWSGANCSTSVEVVPVSSSRVSVQGASVSYDHAADLDAGTTYCVTYQAGLFRDLAGNQVAAMTTSSAGRVVFETAISAPPSSPPSTSPPATVAPQNTTAPPVATTVPVVEPSNDGDVQANLNDDLEISGTSGTAVASDGSTFGIGKSGAISLKLWTGYIGTASGYVRASYKVGKVTKRWQCTIKSVSIDKVNKKAKRSSGGWFPKKFKPVKNSCVLPAQLRTALKTQKVVLSARVRFVKMWPTTGKAVNPETGKRIPVGIRNLRISLGKAVS